MRRPSIRGSQGQPGYIMTEEVEQVRPVAPIAGRKCQGVKAVADTEAVGDGPAGGNGPEGGEAGAIVAEVVEQVRPIAQIFGHKRQGVKVVADAEAVSDGAVGGNGPERGKAVLDVWHFQDLLFGIRLVCYCYRSRENHFGDRRRVR